MLNGMTPAIVGTGPSFSDVHDPAALVANRYCVALNGAIRVLPTAQAAHFEDLKQLNANWKFISKDTFVIITNRVVAQLEIPRNTKNKVLYRQAQNFLDQHPEKQVSVFDHKTQGRDCSVFCASTYLLMRHEQRRIELYGIDLDKPEYAGHAKRLVNMTRQGVSFVNCCPSSKLMSFPFEPRPWAKQQWTTPPF